MNEISSSAQSASSPSRLWLALAVLGLGLAATSLRIAAARGELWFDEVWTIQGVQAAVHSPADILLTVNHDNNHFLNSLVVYFIGTDGAAGLYRAPAVLAGALTVLLAAWIQRRRGWAAMFAALILTGFSYLLVNYSSEARGYAYEMFFALAAFGILCATEVRPALGWEILFTATCIFGFLSHPLFLSVYLSAQVWTWFVAFQLNPENRRWPTTSSILFRTLIPGLFFAWLYWVNLRGLTIGGGDTTPYFDVVVQTLSLTLGGPFDSPASYVVAVITLLVSAAAFANEFKRSPQRAVFYLCVILVFPILLLAVAPREDLYPRYFLISVLFTLLLWSNFLGDVCRRWKYGNIFATAALLAFTLANGWHIAQLVTLGRNHYLRVLQTIEDQTQGQHAVVLVDHAYRQEPLLDFYAHQLPLPKPIEIFSAAPEESAPAEWYLTHNPNPSFVPPETITAPDGATFRLVEHERFAGLSGWNLCLYHRQP